MLLAGCQPSPAPTLSAITHATLIDGTGAAPVQDVTVLIEEDRILRVGPSSTTEVPAGAEVIDGSGAFLLPGFWDMHVHVSRSLGGPEALPAFLAWGVTGIRDVGSSDSIAMWARETESGARPGPRILKAGPQIGVWADREELLQPHLDAVRSQEDIPRLLERRRGWADYIKLQDGFAPREIWLAVAGAAKAEGYLVAGHIPVNVPLPEAIDAGLRSVEHVFGLPMAISGEEVALRAEIVSGEEWWDDLIAADVEALGSLDEARLAEVVRRMAAAGAALDPTLNEVSAFATAWTGRWLDDPRMAHVPEFVRSRWRQDAEAMDSVLIANYETLWRAVPGLVGRMHDMGATIVAGSGAGTFFTFPGSGLHDELVFLVQAGLTPMEAIQSATRDPMVLMGRSGSFGTVEAGKMADLVLLEADPLADIANTRRVVGVCKGGRYFDRGQLKAMLAAVAAEQAVR